MAGATASPARADPSRAAGPDLGSKTAPSLDARGHAGGGAGGVRRRVLVSQRFVVSPSRQTATSRRAHLAARHGVWSRLFPRPQAGRLLLEWARPRSIG